MTIRLPIIVLVSTLAGCSQLLTSQYYGPQGTPLFSGMGPHGRRVTTREPGAQKFFDQGLTWAYAFNHDEAIRSFKEAAGLDPNCAMAWWGVALCNGPHINYPMMSEAQSKEAWDALQKAVALKNAANPAEQRLIEALERRYAQTPPSDRRPLDEAYAWAMEQVWRAFPDDPDIGALFAESLMDLQPWDLWDKTGAPKGRTREILAVLEEVLRLDPDHPGANHFYIHAVEASPHPEKGLAAADALRELVPISGHLVHMPSHIDIRTGHLDRAVTANIKAIKADRRYYKLSPTQNLYRIYMAHNQHFLSFAAMMAGRRELAWIAANDMVASIPLEYRKSQSAFVDPLTPVVTDVLMRFGLWDEILLEPEPPAYLPITRAKWHFARGSALAAKGDPDRAEQELAAMRVIVAALPADALMVINPARKVLAIADHVLTGEIAYRRGQTDAAIASLRQAAAIEDDLQYMEPPDWMQPVRHSLGAILLDAGRAAEAEQVYREDLSEWPENIWSLYGLTQCLKSRGSPEAAEVETRFAKAATQADTRIGASCLCVRTAANGTGSK